MGEKSIPYSRHSHFSLYRQDPNSPRTIRIKQLLTPVLPQELA